MMTIELDEKLRLLGQARSVSNCSCLWLRGVDWFAWAMCGGSSAVLLAAETGVGDFLVDARGSFVLTDDIEAARLRAEEVPAELAILSTPWAEVGGKDRLVRERIGNGPIASDRPRAGETALPSTLVQARWSLVSAEVARYRRLGSESATAVGEVLHAARPDWTEYQLAGAAARALWSRGIEPALILAAGARRLEHYRHPVPGPEKLGARAMLVVCARRHGLYANLTRMVAFREPTRIERALEEAVLEVERIALSATRPGAVLGEVFGQIVEAYRRVGHPGAEELHHQGGPCGYLARDAIAHPTSELRLAASGAVAWNPSLPGMKVEDTILATDENLEVLTVDPTWPTVELGGLRRPTVLVSD